MATKLALYCQALGHLKEAKIASLAEATERRYVLDDYYDDAQLWCLRAGYWNFAIRTVSIDASDTLEVSFGFQNAFEKPEDWVKTYRLSASETFAVPMFGDELAEEAGVWYANIDPLYVQYVSSSTSYGLDLSLWTPDFQLFFTLHLAWLANNRITKSDALWETLRKERDKQKRRAQATEAMDQTIGVKPSGSWVRSRNASSLTIDRTRR